MTIANAGPPNLGPCFECGKPAEHRHHVVPRSLGGTKTIPLCTPCHRKVHAPGQALALGELNHITRSRRRLTWVCDHCGDPIRDGEGVIELDYYDLGRYRREIRDWQAATPHSLGLFPESPRWRVVHYTCDGNPDAVTYWIPVENARTLEQALDRTYHLATKAAMQPAMSSWHARIAQATTQRAGR